MKQWQELQTKFSELSDRERLMIFVALPVVILLLFYTLVLEPRWLEIDNQKRKISSLQQQLPEYSAQVLELSDRLSLDVNEADNNAIDALNHEIEAKQQALGQRVMGLILPEQMPAVLAQMLVSTRHVELVSLVSNTPTALSEGLYQHGLTLQLRGKYFDLMKVLKAMEALPQQFYWHSVEYRVDAYPNALMTLEIYTLGTEKELIRVGSRSFDS
ncbi:type II secretion system protein GspM [Ferrimonas aestuarii]|uniref:Type II secretion system protein M n=1 Tax=Ferrimonas aestuarii TaxID=2569539 RepID=A0A4U1BRF8_9GAMM|nr:type II secretion system protein GspM [Ferrimonas aestuarii]TKB55999.1 type II secretion system protein M [Ferrimonas aestuarii]